MPCFSCVQLLQDPWGIVEKIQKNILALFLRKSGLFFLWRLWPACMLSCFLTLLWQNSFGLENDQFYPEEKRFCKTVGKRVKSELWYTCSFVAFFPFTSKPSLLFSSGTALLESIFNMSSDLGSIAEEKTVQAHSLILSVIILSHILPIPFDVRKSFCCT